MTSRRSSAKLSAGDIEAESLVSLASKLARPLDDGVSIFLSDKLDGGTKELVAKCQGSQRIPADLETSLIKDLNSIITGPCIYEAKRFKSVVLRPETEELLNSNPGDQQDVALLNRFLVEDAYPLEFLAKSGIFPRTLWTVVLNAKAGSDCALKVLLLRYQEPLLVRLTWKLNKDVDKAKEFLQSFNEKLLDKNFLENFQIQNCKFRSFLLQVLDHFTEDRLEKEHAKKRGGGMHVVSLDEDDEEGTAIRNPSSPGPAPDEAVIGQETAAWVGVLVSNALQQLEEKERAKEDGGACFAALKPVIYGEENVLSYDQIGKSLGMTYTAVKTQVHRLRKQLERLVVAGIKETVTNEEDWKEECRDLIRRLPQAPDTRL